MLSAIQSFDKLSLAPTVTIERTLLDPPREPSEATTKWVKGPDGKWHEDNAPMPASSGKGVMQARPHEMHGQCYGFEAKRSTWSAPRMTFSSEAAARPGYDTLDASEYKDEDAVLLAKVTELARLIKDAQCTVMYAGAGLSTAAGIDDYASRNRHAAAPDGERLRSPMCAQPTLSHRVIVGMHRAGQLHRLLQQNHDGLPQKAGLPQEAVNEIHGALHAPDNPVIPMSGSLRSDLLDDMLELEARADLVLAVGTTLAGMNADRVIYSCAARASVTASAGRIGGAVVIGLQRTKLDAECTLRIFATCDAVFALLAEALALGELVPPPRAKGEYFTPPVLRRATTQALPPRVPLQVRFPELAEVCSGGIEPSNYLLHGLAYDAMGRRMESARLPAQLDLDLRQGASVLIPSGMHAGASGVVQGYDREGNIKVVFELRVKRASSFRAPMAMVVGTWWLQAAFDGTVMTLPVVNLPREEDTSNAAEEVRALREAYEKA